DGDQSLDERRARGRRADPRLLHRLAERVVLDVLARRLHRGEERGLGVAPRRLGLLREGLERAGLDLLALFEPRQQLVAPGVVVLRAPLLRRLAVDRAPAG